MKIFLLITFILGLIYILVPVPSKIADVPSLPQSLKSGEPGDTYQNPNNSAYFSDWRRGYVTYFYKKTFEDLNNLKFFGIQLPAIKLNHAPEDAYSYIRDQQNSTFLEEYAYPLRGSLFVNGEEPFDENGKPFSTTSLPFIENGIIYDSKTTLRIYGSDFIFRLIVYLGIWGVSVLLWKLWSEELENKA